MRYQSTFRQIDTVTRLNAQTNKNADKVYWIGSKYILSLLSLNWQTTSHAERGKCLRMLGSAGEMQNSQRFALTELLLQKCVWNLCGVYCTKFELFLLKILMWKSEKKDSVLRNYFLGIWIRKTSANFPRAGGVWGGMRAGFRNSFLALKPLKKYQKMLIYLYMSNTKDIKKQYNDFNEHFSESITKDDNISRNAFYKAISLDLRNKKLLDLACGDGQDILEYQKRGALCEGIDASDNLIATAQKNFPEVTFMVGDMSKLPYENNTFDVVFSKYAIGTESDVNKVFSEVFRILKVGGVFMYLTTHPMRLFLEQGEGRKDYFTQKLVDLVVYGGKFTITEPSHTFNDFFTPDFFNMFDMLAFSEHYDPQSADFPGRDIYPDFFIVTAQKK